MANYAILKAAIEAVIYENGNQEITGSVMQATLLAMVNSLGANYQYAGIATPSTNPGTPDQNVFYLASTAGTYVNFGNIVLAENEVAILKYNGSWTKEASGFASAEKVNQLEQEVTNIDLSTAEVKNYWIDATKYSGKGTHYSIPLPPGVTTVTVTTGSAQGVLAFVKSDNASSGGNLDFATGQSSRIVMAANSSETYIKPSDAAFVIIGKTAATGVDFSPSALSTMAQFSIPQRFAAIEQKNAEQDAEIEDINETLIEINGSSNTPSFTVERGTLSWSGGNQTAANRLRTVGYIEADSLRIDPGTAKVYVYGYAADNTWVSSEGWITTEQVVTLRGAVKYRIVFSYTNDADIFISDYGSLGVVITAIMNSLYVPAAEFDVRLPKVLAPSKLRVVSYNIGHFSGGVSQNSSITASNYAAKLAAYRAVVADFDADVLGIEEFSHVFGINTLGANAYTKDVLLESFIGYEGIQRKYSCNALFYKTVIENITTNEFECNESATIVDPSAITAPEYYYLDADLYMHGERVKLVITHLAFDNTNPQIVSNQISELITKYASYEKVIMVGDWNVNTFSLFDAFTTAGYTMANDGTYYTYPSGERALDNIIVKGLYISNVGMVETIDLSDHLPFYCDISITNP